MRIEISNNELWNLLKHGTLNQQIFRYHLSFKEFEQVINSLEDLESDLDLRDLLNGGRLNTYPAGVSVDEELILFKNNEKIVTLGN